MSREAAFEQLATLQALFLERVATLSDEEFASQFHSDLSPPGWHLGHCVFTELYWIREVVMGEPTLSRPLKGLYVPEHSPKEARGEALPPRDSLCEWSRGIQEENRRLLERLVQRGHEHVLLRDLFLLDFLVQHYSQHYETLMYVLARREAPQDPALNAALKPKPVSTTSRTVAAGRHTVGNTTAHAPYDNERPAFTAELGEFHIAANPVSNAEFLGFMEAGGYNTRVLWTDAGWKWRTQRDIRHPLHWHRNGGGWIAADGNGPAVLDGDAPVFGICHHEAQAFARWAGARLPHEYEWEAAARGGALENDGTVWEWCANAFHPYTGFEAFPYAGYSVPYFDERHFTLRGGSVWTLPSIRRPSFRNYYEADKRHIRAGLRLVFS